METRPDYVARSPQQWTLGRVMSETTNNEQQAGPYKFEWDFAENADRLVGPSRFVCYALGERIKDRLNAQHRQIEEQAAEIERLRGAFKECVELASNAITGPVTIIDPAAEADHANGK